MPHVCRKSAYRPRTYKAIVLIFKSPKPWLIDIAIRIRLSCTHCPETVDHWPMTSALILIKTRAWPFSGKQIMAFLFGWRFLRSEERRVGKEWRSRGSPKSGARDRGALRRDAT